MTDVPFGWRVNERKRGLPRIIACPYALLLLHISPRPNFTLIHLRIYTPVQTGGTTSCHAPVINFHAPAGRCVAFVRIYGVTRPLGRRGRRDDSGGRMGRSRSRGSRERLIFQGNTWRYFGLYSVGDISEVDFVDILSPEMSCQIFSCHPRHCCMLGANPFQSMLNSKIIFKNIKMKI